MTRSHLKRDEQKRISKILVIFNIWFVEQKKERTRHRKNENYFFLRRRRSHANCFSSFFWKISSKKIFVFCFCFAARQLGQCYKSFFETVFPLLLVCFVTLQTTFCHISSHSDQHFVTLQGNWTKSFYEILWTGVSCCRAPLVRTKFL